MSNIDKIELHGLIGDILEIEKGTKTNYLDVLKKTQNPKLSRLKEIISEKFKISFEQNENIDRKHLKSLFEGDDSYENSLTRKKLTILDKHSQILTELTHYLGLSIEKEIPSMGKELNNYFIRTRYNTLKKITFEGLYTKILELAYKEKEIGEQKDIKFKRKDLKDVLDLTPSKQRNYDILTLNNGLYDLNKGEFLNKERIIQKYGKPIIT
ncbi:MAG: hypothetical protein LBB45_02060 [Methanobrevibacter sp.]|jgi:hypothetical protein|nr:hypothetical protein [Candidatus Methanovirga basalitermitum]